MTHTSYFPEKQLSLIPQLHYTCPLFLGQGNYGPVAMILVSYLACPLFQRNSATTVVDMQF